LLTQYALMGKMKGESGKGINVKWRMENGK
jgi:hypothetical protein